jgi:hypothetical protein
MLNDFNGCEHLRLPQPAERALVAAGARRYNRFEEVRSTGAPVIGIETILAAPFGWTGLMRLLGQRVGTRLKDSQIRIRVLAIMPAGISIELSKLGSAHNRIELHAIANDIGKAAAAIDPETGLLNEYALSDLTKWMVAPKGDCPPQFAGILSALDGSDLTIRSRLACRLSEIRFGHTAGWPASATQRILRWRIGFPPGATSAEIVGIKDAATALPIAEPVIVLGRLREWIVTVSGGYALDRESWELI